MTLYYSIDTIKYGIERQFEDEFRFLTCQTWPSFKKKKKKKIVAKALDGQRFPLPLC